MLLSDLKQNAFNDQRKQYGKDALDQNGGSEIPGITQDSGDQCKNNPEHNGPDC
jgi:hypothetical protein